MKFILPLASVIFASVGAIAHADPVEQLKGAWVTEGANCSKIFEKAGGRIKFKDRSTSLSLDTGIIILRKDRVKGPMGGCTISKTAEESNQFSAQLHCSDGLVSRDFSMSFRIIDGTHFERTDQKFEGIHWVYTKCPL